MKHLFMLFSFVILFSCTDSKRKEIDKVSEEVIVLHDEVMPLMDELYKTRMQLQNSEADSVAIIQNNTEVVISDIKLAEEAMMIWMRNFDPGFEGENDDETLLYLYEQKKTIQVVADQMKRARDKGQELLNRE